MKTLSFILLFSFGGISFAQINCVNIPAQNKKIVAYVKSKIGKPIDLDDNEFVEKAYSVAGIQNFKFGLGESVMYQLDCVYPGDIISLGWCETKWKRNDTAFAMNYTCDHYFIIYKVKSSENGIYQIAQLEVNSKDQMVIKIRDFSLSYIKKGRGAIIWRPRSK